MIAYITKLKNNVYRIIMRNIRLDLECDLAIIVDESFSIAGHNISFNIYGFKNIVEFRRILNRYFIKAIKVDSTNKLGLNQNSFTDLYCADNLSDDDVDTTTGTISTADSDDASITDTSDTDASIDYDGNRMETFYENFVNQLIDE